MASAIDSLLAQTLSSYERIKNLPASCGPDSKEVKLFALVAAAVKPPVFEQLIVWLPVKLRFGDASPLLELQPSPSRNYAEPAQEPIVFADPSEELKQWAGEAAELVRKAKAEAEATEAAAREMADRSLSGSSATPTEQFRSMERYAEDRAQTLQTVEDALRDAEKGQFGRAEANFFLQ